MLRRVFPLLTLLILAAAAQAAPDIFMRVEGIPGDATDAQHRDEIVVASYSFNIAQSASPSRGGGASAGRATVTPFVVTKPVDSASPRLAIASLRGQVLPRVDITVRRPGQARDEYLRFTLTDVVVSGFAQEAPSENAAPVETVQLSYGTIVMEYVPQRSGGAAGAPVRMGWDVQRNAAL